MALHGHFKAGEAGSLYLLAAPAKQILEYGKFFGDARANPLIHEGIEVDGEEASQIYYSHEGKWLELQGNDQGCSSAGFPRVRPGSWRERRRLQFDV